MANTFAQITGLHKIFSLSGTRYNVDTVIEAVEDDIDTRTVVFLTADAEDNNKILMLDNGNPVNISFGDTFVWTHGSIYVCNALDNRGYKYDKMHGSIAQGTTEASGNDSHAEGVGSVASGRGSHAEGAGSKATAQSAHAEGLGTIASGERSHAEGEYTVSSGISSHAEGNQTIASGIEAHTEGRHTTASGDFSHSEGHNTEAQGTSSHAEGSGSVGLTECSHAEGWGTSAEGWISHTEGKDTKTSGPYSHAEGLGTIAQGAAQHVSGEYNTPDDTSLLIVGNGTNDGMRSNAMTVGRDGHVTAAAFDQSSDIRLKDVCGDIDLSRAYELIDKCDTILYTLKNRPEDGQQLGMIAQQVQDFFPEIVGKDPSGFLTLDYARLTVIIIRVLKDLIDKINNL